MRLGFILMMKRNLCDFLKNVDYKIEHCFNLYNLKFKTRELI